MTEIPEGQDARADDDRLVPADEPSPLGDTDLDEVGEGDAERTQYGLRSTPQDTTPIENDPGSQLNF